jgi:hypothetical protein
MCYRLVTWSRLFFTRVFLCNVKAIMVFMRVSLVELLHQAVMGWILVLEYVLSGSCGLLRPHPVVQGTQSRRSPRPRGW